MLKKYRKIPLILTGLAGIALLTTGFSAWVIQGTTPATTNEMVNITVGEVKDNRIKAEILSDSTFDKTVKFDSNKAGGTKIVGDGEKEDMKFGATVSISLANPSKAPTTDPDIETILANVKFDLTVNTKSANYSNYQSVTTNGIRVPGIDPSNESATTYTLSPSGDSWVTNSGTPYYWKKDNNDQTSYLRCSYDVTLDTDINKITIKFKYGFGWGSAFEYVNPCDAKFSNDTNDTNLNAALSELQNLYKINGATDLFTLTVTPSTASNN